MSEALPVHIPLLNPNEPEASLAALHVQQGQLVAAGDLLCTLETTKSAADLHAEGQGYIAGLTARQGETLRAGDVLCYLAPTPDWQPPAAQAPQAALSELPEGLRITQPALILAQKHELDLSRLPAGVLITEKMVQEQLQPAKMYAPPASPFDSTAIIVYGGGGHGKALIELLRALGVYRIVGVVDDGVPAGEVVMGLPFLGGHEALPGLYAQGVRLAVNAVGGIGNVGIRISVFKHLAEAMFACPAVVHPRAFIEPSAVLSPGAQVFAQAYVGSEARIGYGAIINTGAIVSHDCQVGDYANLSPGAILAGEVQIGAGSLVGMGATINLRVRVGNGARIGNNATVKDDVTENGIVRAGATWPA
ncbi:MAG: NeuD/PglB/VioB family sugar acetyltransferase [Anaerolineales bacterium]|nr:NeuD/PglB/VioB family sugar acetyltransferase [Anaerolineales bacterium]